MSESMDTTTVNSTTLPQEGAANGLAGAVAGAPDGVSVAREATPVALAEQPTEKPAESLPAPGLPSQGLTEAEVAARRARGLGN